MFPIGDFPNPRGHVPLVTYALIAINVLIYFFVTIPLSESSTVSRVQLDEYLRVMSEAIGRDQLEALLRQVSAYDIYLFQHAFRSSDPSLSGLFYSMFLHAGFAHLAGNMLFLWIYGDNVEHRLGAVRYVLAYLGTGIAATAFHFFSAPSSPIPMIGASGAISGVLGFYFVFFPRNRVRLLVFLPPFIQTLEVPARLVLGLYLIVDNLLPYLFVRSDVGVAHGAHIGGFVAGLGVAWLMERRAIDKPPAEYAAAPTHRPAIGEGIARAIDDGQMDEAARDYFELPASATHRLLVPEHALDLATWLEQKGHDRAALTVLRRLIRDFPNGPRLAEALVAAGRIHLDRLGDPTTAYQYFLGALDLRPGGAPESEARRALETIESMQKRRIGRSM